MEKIEIKSQNVRTIIGGIPPLIIRIGNVLIIFTLIILVGLSFIIKVPNTLNCEVLMGKQSSEKVRFKILILDKLIQKPIIKGTKIKLYKDDNLLFTGELSSDLFQLQLRGNKIYTTPKIILMNTNLNNKINLSISENTKLKGQIILKEKSVLENILNN